MPCLKCQNLLLKTKMKNRMKRIECTVSIIQPKCKQKDYLTPSQRRKGHVFFQMCLLFLQTMVSLANELPIILENKVNMPCMYSFVYIVYLKIMLITYINLSESRSIIQSATLLIDKFKGKVSYGIRTKCLAFKTQ